MWQRIRRKWSDPRVEPGYNEGGVIKTTDGGKTWADASQGLPQPELRGRIGIDIARSKPDTLYAIVDNYEIGAWREPGEHDAYGRPMPQGQGFIKGADVYRSDDGGQDVAADEPPRRGDDAIPEQPFRHLRLGVRSDSRRPDEREHDLDMGSRPEQVDRRRQDVHGSRRHARRSPRPVDRSGEHERSSTTPTTAASTSRPTAARPGGSPSRRRRAVLQHRRSTRARRSGRTAPSRITAAGAGGSIIRTRARQRRRRWRSKTRPAAKAPITRSIRAIRTSCTRMASTATSAGPISRRRRRRRPGRGRGRGGRSDADPADRSGRRAARPVDGADHHLAARQQHHLSRAIQSCSGREPRRQLGEDQPRPDRQQPRRRWARTRPPSPTRRSSRSPNRRAEEGPALRRQRRRPAARRRSTAARNGRSSRHDCRCADGFRDSCRPSMRNGTVYVTQRGREDDDFGAYIYKSTDTAGRSEHLRTTSRPVP